MGSFLSYSRVSGYSWVSRQERGRAMWWL